jgi:ABC-type amino acid transport substrate-binding protein
MPRSLPLILVIVLVATPVMAQQPAAPARTLVVAVKDAPPFAIKDSDGQWTGISIELWRAISRDLGYRFELRETDLQGLLRGVADGSFDAGVAAVTITAEREQQLDFTQPFYVAGLGIAVPARSDAGWLGVARQFVSVGFLKVILGLTALLLLVGTMVWLLERRRNAEQFGGNAARGISSSIWWSAVTMTTVGYGDMAPRTVGGRLVGLVWMFAGVIIISSFTAAITSSLTVGRLNGPVEGPEDLISARVGTATGSTSADYLTGRHVPFTAFDTPSAALGALQRGTLDAVVYDAPILRYEITTSFHGTLRVLADTFDQQYYGIALPARSPLREPMDRALLARITTPEWQSVLARYLGQ